MSVTFLWLPIGIRLSHFFYFDAEGDFGSFSSIATLMPKTSILASRGTGRDLPEQAPSTRESEDVWGRGGKTPDCRGGQEGRLEWATRDASTAIRRPRGMTNCLCGRSEDADSIAAVVPAVILLRKGDWEDLFDKSEVSPQFLNTIYSQYRSGFPPKYHENYQFIFKPA